MNKILIIILATIFGAIISGGIVYLVLDKEIQEWQLIVNAQQDHLSALKN